MSKRIARLNEQLKREISEIIRTQVRDPRVGLVTVTNVQVAADLGSARVRVRIMGTDAERVESLKGLEKAAPFMRRALGQILHIRQIPELRFSEDRALEHAARIEAILHEVLPEDEEAPGDEGDGADEADDGPEDPDEDAAAPDDEELPG